MTTRTFVGKQKDIVRQFFQYFSAGDVPAVISLFRRCDLLASIYAQDAEHGRACGGVKVTGVMDASVRNVRRASARARAFKAANFTMARLARFILVAES